MRRVMAGPGYVLGLFLALVAGSPAALAVSNGHIAYTDIVDKDTPAARRAVFIERGGQLTHPAVGDADSAPAWSADGKSLAFARLSGQTRQYSVMVADADGSNVRVRLSPFDSGGNPTALYGKKPISLTWSPDGNVVGGVWTEPGQIGGTPFGASLPEFFGYSFDWGVSGKVYSCLNFLPVSDHQLFCLYDGGAVQRTGTNEPGALGGGLIVAPHWKIPSFPSIRRVVFGAGRSVAGCPGCGSSTGGVFSIEPADSRVPGNVYGTDLREVTKDPGTTACTETIGGVPSTRVTAATSYLNPVPSPDGKYIVVKRYENEYSLNATTKRCDLKQTTSIAVLRESGGFQSTVATGSSVDEPAWQPSPANVTVVIDDGHDHQLRGLKVALYPQQGETPSYANPVNTADGQYQFENVLGGTYRVRATLDDNEGQAFEVRDGYPATEAVWVEWRLVVDPDAENIEKRFSFEESVGILATSLGTGGAWWRLDDMAVIYYQTRRFVDWVKARLTPNTGAKVPFYVFATTSPVQGVMPTDAFYEAGAVYLGTQLSEYASRDDSSDNAPVNVEWHEFTHHLDASNRGSSVECVGEESHRGYKNPSTCNSLAEGVANFLPTMLTRDPDYAGITNLEFHTKAWGFRILGDPNQANMEDLAVAALLWDLVDGSADSEYTLAIGANGLHLPVTYTDNVSLPLQALWGLLGTVRPATVYELQQALKATAGALTIDLDNDGVRDINDFDSVFLMHGFFPIDPDQSISEAHTTYHYSVGVARLLGLGANDHVGRSNHFGFTWGDYSSPTWIPRFNTLAAERANLDIQVRDASGTPLEGADLTIMVHYPGTDQPVLRRLGQGDNNLVHLELPVYFDHIPTGPALPACAFVTDLYVSVTLSASINGYVSDDQPAFDNCVYVQAVAAANGPAALAYTMRFPEDSAVPVTTIQAIASGPVFGSSTSGTWSVEMTCVDPTVAGFASGCARSEYRIDGGTLLRYTDSVTIAELGQHVFEYRSLDAAANAEAFRSIALNVTAGPPAAITGFLPTSGPAGTAVTITGANLNGATSVTFNGVSASYTAGTATQISATVPPGATTGPIAVTTPNNTATSTATFTVIQPPSIAGVSPGSGPVGTVVTIAGANLDGTTGVAFSGVTASYTVTSATQLTATVPVGATTGAIAVTTPGGTVESSTSFVVTVGPAPSITSFMPPSGGVGTAVTLKGANLSATSSVTFNGTSASFKVKGSSQITATVPVGATTGSVAVTTPGGTATTATGFVMIAPPTITGFSPSSGAVGSLVTLQGTSLTGTTSVKFGGANANFTVVSSTVISATVPKSAKSGPISATTAAGTATSAGSFAVTK